jgi:hypothetical protein
MYLLSIGQVQGDLKPKRKKVENFIIRNLLRRCKMKITKETSCKIEVDVDELIKIFQEKGWLPKEEVEYRGIEIVNPPITGMDIIGTRSTIRLEYNTSTDIREKDIE